jgi:hypothetical protein
MPTPKYPEPGLREYDEFLRELMEEEAPAVDGVFGPIDPRWAPDPDSEDAPDGVD